MKKPKNIKSIVILQEFNSMYLIAIDELYEVICGLWTRKLQANCECKLSSGSRSKVGVAV